MALEEDRAALIVCDRGTLDGLAYWPGSEREYFDDIASTKPDELARYATVIHMRTPWLDHGYMPNQFRIESAAEASLIDAQIDAAWSGHPRRFVIDSDDDFVSKLHRALDLVRAEGPQRGDERLGLLHAHGVSWTAMPISSACSRNRACWSRRSCAFSGSACW